MSDTAANGDKGLRITEIFHSLQGESRPIGLPTAFIRLTGCPLRCTYCDTAYAFHGGERMSIAEILDRIEPFGTRHVCVTGGEPLAQQRCADLLVQLCDNGYDVVLETSGALPIAGIDPRVCIVLDLKTPSSGETDRNLWVNLAELKPDDQIKIVIGDRADFDWARSMVDEKYLTDICPVLFSPVWGNARFAADLADWILASRLDVRFQLQLHKILWGDSPGH